MSVEVRCYTDPACPWSWGCEPQLRRLAWEFGDALRFRWVMGGLAREYRSDGDAVAARMGHWLDVAAKTGMPFDPRAWRDAPLASSYPACIAVKAAAEQGDDRAGAFLRRLREGIFLERRKLDHTEALVAAAGEADLDSGRFRTDLDSNAILEGFAGDLEEVRTVPQGARAEGESKQTRLGERLAMPSLVFVDRDGDRHGVWGPHPYDAYRDAAIAAGAPSPSADPPTPLEVIARFDRLTTREIEEVTARPQIPLEAELWSLARDFRVRPLRVPGGTMWEAA